MGFAALDRNRSKSLLFPKILPRMAGMWFVKVFFQFLFLHFGIGGF